MSEIPPIAIRVFLETGQVVAGANKTENALKGIGNSAEKSSGKTNLLSGAMKALGAVGITASLSAIIHKFDEMGRAAAADAKSQALLANSMENVIGANSSQVASVEDSIQKFSSLYAVLDDDIRPAVSQFVRVTGDATKATQLTDLALNVAAGTGKDMTTVTLALSKAYQGNTASLQRLGINVKGLEDPLGALAKQFDGAAEAAANLDPYQRIQVAMDNTQETIGAALLPAMNDLADFLNSSEFIDAIGDAATQFGDFATGLGIVADETELFLKRIETAFSQFGIKIDFSGFDQFLRRTNWVYGLLMGIKEMGFGWAFWLRAIRKYSLD